MARPAIVWRNPNPVQRCRVWNRAKRDASRSLYLVVESAASAQREWKALPNLEIVRGGAGTARSVAESRSLSSRA